MKFTQRLGYYFAGLAIGLIFLAFFLKKKQEGTGTSFCYLPNCRVLQELRSHPLQYSPELRNTLAEYNLDTTLVTVFLLDGDVKFKESDTRSKPCRTYAIDGEYAEKDWRLTAKVCDSVVTAERLQLQ